MGGRGVVFGWCEMGDFVGVMRTDGESMPHSLWCAGDVGCLEESVSLASGRVEYVLLETTMRMAQCAEWECTRSANGGPTALMGQLPSH